MSGFLSSESNSAAILDEALKSPIGTIADVTKTVSDLAPVAYVGLSAYNAYAENSGQSLDVQAHAVGVATASAATETAATLTVAENTGDLGALAVSAVGFPEVSPVGYGVGFLAGVGLSFTPVGTEFNNFVETQINNLTNFMTNSTPTQNAALEYMGQLQQHPWENPSKL